MSPLVLRMCCFLSSVLTAAWEAGAVPLEPCPLDGKMEAQGGTEVPPALPTPTACILSPPLTACLGLL